MMKSCLKDFRKKFNAELFIDAISLRPCYRDLETKKMYKLFNHTKKELNFLMEESLKQGKDLVLEQCKDDLYSDEERQEDIRKYEHYEAGCFILENCPYLVESAKWEAQFRKSLK